MTNNIIFPKIILFLWTQNRRCKKKKKSNETISDNSNQYNILKNVCALRKISRSMRVTKIEKRILALITWRPKRIIDSSIIFFLPRTYHLYWQTGVEQCKKNTHTLYFYNYYFFYRVTSWCDTDALSYAKIHVADIWKSYINARDIFEIIIFLLYNCP